MAKGFYRFFMRVPKYFKLPSASVTAFASFKAKLRGRAMNQLLCSILFRVALPLALLTGVLFRQNFFSLIYLLLLFIGHLLSGPSPISITYGHTGRYLRATLSISLIICIAQVVFQITLLSLGANDFYGSFIDYCDWKGKLFSIIGLHRLDKVSVLDGFRLVGLDFLVLFVSAFVHVMCSKLVEAQARLASEETTNLETSVSGPQSPPDAPRSCSKVTKTRKKRASDFLVIVGEFLILVFFAGAGIIQPSVLSSVYFVLFLMVATWLACNRRLGRLYLLSRISLLVYTCLHFTAIFAYQTVYAQELIPPESIYARLFGLTALTNCTCENSRTIDFLPLSWTVYVSPLVVLGLYWVLATVTRFRLISPVVEEVQHVADLAVTSVVVDSKQSSQRSSSSLLKRRRTQRRERAKSECMPLEVTDGYGEYFPASRREDSIEETRLLDDDHNAKHYKTLEIPHRHSIAVDPNGSITWNSDSEAHEPSVVPDEATVASGGTKAKYKSAFLSPLLTILSLVAKGSYVATLILMMTWSITYHSWLTFVLLLWSCVLWMMPNSRQACLKTSPFLVIYAEALLIMQYIYSLNLNESELPTKIETVNLAQMGLIKYFTMSYQPLAVKILYTTMFWLTLHQYMQEKARAEQGDQNGVLLEPFNLSYSTTVPGSPQSPRPDGRQMSEASGATISNPLMRKIGAVVTTLLTKYWIWVVACMLMVISLGGQEVVLYRIAYMFLFLLFITMFQISYEKWRKMMYGFWLAMIVYSMLVLILIYTYQFENFDYYWATYLHVSPELQTDIGLEIYKSDAGTLFLKLLTPTFFLIITIIQLHYFHKEFLKISDIDYRPPQVPEENPQNLAALERENIGPPPGPPSTVNAECSATPSPAGVDENEEIKKGKDKYGLKDAKKIVEKNWKKVLSIAQGICEFVWRILEIHIIKIVMFSVLCLAVYDVCAVHFVFIIFVIIALPVTKLQFFLSHCCSLWVSILLLAKMIYQLNFVDKYGWKVNCTDGSGFNQSEVYPFNETIDNRVWIGFKKTTNLTDYCKGYIGLIIVLTIQAVVRIRQMFTRYHTREPVPPHGIVFPEANRSNADDGLLECAKFSINYFFYKFGIEFCLVTIIACIGVRLDAFAVLSAMWLCVMFLMKRSTLAKVWPFYVTYQCIVLPIQYLMCVGIPPGLCLDYPWTQYWNSELVEWMYLPSFINTPNSYKIMVDFFQLIFSCCQLYVFAIETGPSAQTYDGGSNKEIYEVDNFYAANPVPDFVTNSKSYLDMLKSLLFFGFYWVTLAIVFLAGTSRVSLFAMGYVIWCFVFLWSGNEFYLKPIKVLLKMWNALLAYNVAVILLKSILQVIGCVFLTNVYEHACPLAQLLGIVCLKNLKASNSGDLDDQSTCPVSQDEAGLVWDGVCFAFLLLQKRLFCSYYFQHLVNEIKAQQALASRGAEMINEIQMKEVKAQQAVEREVMVKIKKKMDRIRAKHQKAPAGEATQPDTHFQAIRSGDYYMFDEYSDDEIDLDMIAKSNKDVEDEEAAEVKEKGINALLSQAMKGNIPKQNIRKGSEDDDDVGDSSHLSPIISVDRSVEGSSVPHPPISRITSLSLQDTLPVVPSAHGSQHTGPSLPPYDSSHPTDAGQPAAEQAPTDEKLLDRIKSALTFLGAFIDSLLISATAKLNSVSKDYRYVAFQLSREKKILKEKFAAGEKPEDISLFEKDIPKIPPSGTSKSGSAKVAITLQKGSQDLAESIELIDTPDLLDKDFQKDQPAAIRFLIAIYYAVVSRSELVCYLMIVVNQVKYASILSLPLPLMAFLWGSLSVPRPSKLFWITVITYTEAIIVIKYLFQFNFFDWNTKLSSNADLPFYPPRIIGIQQSPNYVVYDLAILLVVFFHRFMLKSLGLWKDSDRSTIAGTTPENTLDEKQDDLDSKDNESLVVDLKEERKKKRMREGAEKEQLAAGGDADHLDGFLSDEEYEELEDEDEKSLECDDISPIEAFYDQILKLFDPFRMFFHNLLHPEYRVTVDVYAYMFFCDFINFLIIVFAYWAFGTGGSEEDVASYFKENKVPIPFLIMLIAQFGLLVVDRALYLRKYIFGKLIFQIFLVFLVHIWMFFILPFVNEKPFTDDKILPPKLWYLIKCVYLLLSAYQIRSGYPTRILGNFFCKKFNYANLFLFKGYLLVPFLYELRSLMDWIWTDTSMNVSNWLKMEDIFVNIFLLKCSRRAEEEYPTPRGSKRTSLIKYGVGGLLLFIIILIIWFPLLLFALGSTVGLPDQPLDFSVVLSVGGYEPIFKMSAQSNSMVQGIGKGQYEGMRSYYEKTLSKPGVKFLSNYDETDVTIVNLNGNSTAIWAISPPSQSALVHELRNNANASASGVNVKFAWSLFRDPNSTGVDKTIVYEANNILKGDVVTRLADMLDGSEELREDGVEIATIFPNYLKASARGILKYDTGLAAKSETLRNLTIYLHSGSFQNSSAIAQWWEVKDSGCTRDPKVFPYPFWAYMNSCNYLQLVIFNERVFPSELSIFSGYGIVGLYTTFVLLVSRMVRGLVAGSSFTIMFDDMPYVDRVLQLCLDIYLVRESGEFTLEEDLFAKLIFLYRSPETLIKWTRLPDHHPEAGHQ